MELKQLIEQNATAMQGFKGQIATLDGDLVAVKTRLKDIEQTVACGAPMPMRGTSSKSIAAQLAEADGFKRFVGGNAKNAKVTLAGPLLAKNTITGDSGSPAQPSNTISAADRMPGIVSGARREFRLRELLPVLPTSSNMVEFTRELAWVNGAAPQAGEGEAKAESSLTFELVQMPVRTIAHFIKASKQSLTDQPALAGLVDDRMLHGVLMEEESQLLSGDGTGHNLDGLIANATAYTGGQTGDTHMDTLRRAMQQVAAADWTASGIVLNTADWTEIELLKDADGNYVLGDPAKKRAALLWGLPVVATNSMPSGEFLVADFQNAAVLWDRETAVVEMFEQDDTNVQQNLVTVRAEERVALTVLRPAAIVHGSFA